MKPGYFFTTLLIAISIGTYYLSQDHSEFNDAESKTENTFPSQHSSSISSSPIVLTQKKSLPNVTLTYIQPKNSSTIDYIELNKKYIASLPNLHSTKMAGNFMPLKPIVDLWSRVQAGDISAKNDYEKQIILLKENADAGDVRAQMDYAMFLFMDATGKIEGNLFERRVALASEAKEYYIQAAVKGQTEAAKAIGTHVVQKPIADTVESLSWIFISQKMGGNINAKYICEKSLTPCTEDMFVKALDRATMYIDFYEFKHVE